MAKPPFGGHRTFTQFTPRRRAATEYELYTVGQQSSPEQWLHVGWPIRFDDGREPYTASSTAIRCGNWPDYRDPAAPPRPGPRLRGRPPDRPFVQPGEDWRWRYARTRSSASRRRSNCSPFSNSWPPDCRWTLR
ncbi:MAG TPA: hypothetical protein VF070_18295 [Streptosporangiaceae bacterium]